MCVCLVFIKEFTYLLTYLLTANAESHRNCLLYRRRVWWRRCCSTSRRSRRTVFTRSATTSTSNSRTQSRPSRRDRPSQRTCVVSTNASLRPSTCSPVCRGSRKRSALRSVSPAFRRHRRHWTCNNKVIWQKAASPYCRPSQRRMHSPESTQPSILRGTVKWVPAKGRWCYVAGE